MWDHSASTVRTFCTDLGIVFQPIVDGDPAAIAHLAELVGAPQATLARNSYQATADGWTLRGEQLLKSSLQRGVPRVCPECILGDIARAGRMPANALAYGRWIWPIVHIRACPIHGRSLITPRPSAQTHHVHDFAALLAPYLGEFERLSTSAPKLEPSPLEAYLLGRLEGRRGELPWLDSLEFSAAAQTCEVIGAVVIRGRKGHLATITDQHWQAAGAAGFKIAAGGEPKIRAWLSSLQLSYPYTRIATEGAQAVFGSLYKWLAYSAPDPTFDPVRDLLRQHIVETMPVGPDDLIFGVPVDKRRLHSIRTASLAYAAHPKRLRKILVNRGLVQETQAFITDARVLIPAEAIAQLHADGVIDGLPLDDVGDYINAPRPHPQMLYDAGLITPIISAKAPGIGDHAFAKKDLDRFLEDLLGHAVSVTVTPETAGTILNAAKRSNCSSIEIVRLILDRKLAWVGQLASATGYLSVLVDVEEIRGHVRGPALDGFTAHAIMKDMGTSTKTVVALIANNILPTITVTNPTNRCPVEIVPTEIYAEFRRQFVTLFQLAAELGVHFRRLSAALAASGIAPALVPKTFGATFYRRADVERAGIHETGRSLDQLDATPRRLASYDPKRGDF